VAKSVHRSGGRGLHFSPKRFAVPILLILTWSIALAQDNGGVAPQNPSPSAQQSPGTVTNLYTDTDIRAVLEEIGQLSGVPVIADSTVVSQNISIEFKDEPIDQAVARVAAFGGYLFKRKGNLIMVSSAVPDAPLFHEFAVFRRYIAQNTPADSIQNLLPQAFKLFTQVDKNTNMITIFAAEPRADEIIAALKALDAPVRQLDVEALVTEVTIEKGDDFGFSWNWNKFAMDSGQNISYANIGSTDVAKVKALITSGKATVRANPHISALEARESTLTVGQDFYFSLSSGNPNFPFSQVQQIHTGVTLKFTAFIGDDGYITLNLAPEIGDAVTLTAQGNPTVTIRRATTTVRIKPGDTVAIGGLVQEFDKQNVSKTPVLGDLPLLGWLFRRQVTSHKKTELIIMISPHLSSPPLVDKDGKVNSRVAETPPKKATGDVSGG